MRPLTVLWNQTFGYLAYVFAAALSVVCMPAYYSDLGPSEFSVMMLMAAMQAWLQLADLGYSGALSRQLAIYKSDRRYRALAELLSAAKKVALPASFILGVTLVIVALLVLSKLDFENFASLKIIAAWAIVVLTIRWTSEIFRSALIGMGAFGHSGLIVAASVLVRIPIALLVIRISGGGLRDWLVINAIASAVELYCILSAARAASDVHLNIDLPRGYVVVKSLAYRASPIFFSSLAWLAISNVDKVLLPVVVGLTAYAPVAIASAVPGVFFLVIAPILQLALPRLIEIKAQGSRIAAEEYYIRTSRLVAFLVAPLFCMLLFQAREIVSFWFGMRLGRDELDVAHYVMVYGVGSISLALASTPYIWLSAEGNLRLHLFGTTLLAIGLIFGLVVGAMLSGLRLAVMVWAGVCVVYYVLWPMYIHNRHSSGLHLRWIMSSASVFLPVATLALVGRSLIDWPATPAGQFFALLLLAMVLQGVSLFAFLGFKFPRPS